MGVRSDLVATAAVIGFAVVIPRYATCLLGAQGPGSLEVGVKMLGACAGVGM